MAINIFGWSDLEPRPSTESLIALNKVANLYPATTAGTALPALSEGVEFYGGQKIYDVFATASGQVKADFTWGPTLKSQSVPVKE